MDRETDIFDADILENSSGDLDVDLVNAGQLLQKLAAEEGIDLDSLPDHVVEDLMRDIVVPQPHIEQPQETRKEASAMDQQTHQIPNEPTYADVAVELSKIASAEGINLDEVSREEYHEAFANLANKMADPSYFATKQAADEEEAKLASAYAQGQVMADGFLDRLQEAEPEETKEASKLRAAFGAAKEKAKGLIGKARSGASHAGRTVARGAHAADKKVQKGGEKLLNAVGAGAEKASPGLKRGVGLGAAGAAAGAAAGGGVAAHRMSKKSFDEAAEQLAVELAQEMGIDLSDKTAGAEEYSADALAERAVEMLKEAGYLPQE